MDRKPLLVLSLAAVFLSLSTVAVQIALIHTMDTGEQHLTAKASARIDFCINGPPTLTVPCNTTLSQNSSFFCQLGFSDVDNNTVTVTRSFAGTSPIFNMTAGGTINFTPTNDDVGNYTVIFTAADDSGCENSRTNETFMFSVANINDAPVLAEDIPDQSMTTNTTLSAFFLDDYFTDPDGDPLTYTSTNPEGVTVVISPSSEVRFTSNTCTPDGVLVTFTATDPFNATAESNAVEIVVVCEPASTSGDGQEGGGGGGGGGGAVRDCRSEWECQEWFACLPSGLQWRRCYDLNGCENERYLQRYCTYGGEIPSCNENWLCSQWSVCYVNGTQYRTCEDLNACSSEFVKPPEMQECVYIPMCTDGIKNGNETGVDCGGDCPACPLIEQPAIITGDAGLATWLLILIILAVLVLSGVLHYYRGEIAQLIATLGFMLRHKVVKDVLLDAAERKALFEKLVLFERELDGMPGDRIYDSLSSLIRGYASDALHIPVETLPEEVAARCDELGLRKETKALVADIFGKLAVIENEDVEVDSYFVVATIEQLRSTVCLTSEYTQGEISRPIIEVEISEEMSFYDEVYARMINVLRAMQFGQVDAAKKEYRLLLEKYDPLSDEEKNRVYPELLWVFRATKLQDEATGARVVKKPAVA